MSSDEDPGPSQDLERLRSELDGYRTYLGELSQDLARARELLFRLVGDDDAPCRLDDQGRCQQHGSDAPCAVREARLWLGYPDD